MEQYSALDMAIAVVIGIAVVRGAFVGMIREGFSIAAIGAAILAGRYGAESTGAWLNEASAGEIGGSAAMWLGAALCAVLGGIMVAAAGRWLRRGARMVGLGLADRVGGAAVGAAEGTLVASLMILGATTTFGAEHPAVYGSYSVALMEDVRTAVETGEFPDLDLPMVGTAPPGAVPRR
jgi:uncharacterized membrane protein required for colicin V production